MSGYLCHDEPDLMEFETRVLDLGPRAVLLERSAFYPGGGGQPVDRGVLRWSAGEARVEAIEPDGDGRHWHLLDRDPPAGCDDLVQASIDRGYRSLMCQLHTDLHIVNALVYQAFAGALVTGAQMAGDGTARVDFDLPDGDNDRLRALEPEINAWIARGVDVRDFHMEAAHAAAEPGLLRSRSVAPPVQPDGRIRIVEITGLDRQACGGTHVANTAQSRPVRILKVENKGRHNRRVRIALV
jgi:misacylated tRNA(Ala) deacylase